MPFGLHPTCNLCSASESEMWHKLDNGQIQCNKCITTDIKIQENNDSGNKSKENNDSGNKSKENEKTNGEETKANNNKKTTKPPMVALRKSARYKAKIRNSVQNKPTTVKGKSRRIVFKRNVYRSPNSFATTSTLQSLFFKGQYYQVGDIVSMNDIDGGTYYAQITGFLQDQYCEKSATVTWLLPSQQSPTDTFDPSTYFLGPEEDVPRRLECMQFICHAPSDYYKSASSPYPTLPQIPERGFIWTKLGPQVLYKSDTNHINDINEIQSNSI